ncbi:MAG: PDZ domain-containing protein [Clostridiales bacterium]|nr:PDZ domain-containing protein [Clostridiales bacterium]MCF8022369.1 PDZ domain-containing protein [Clostridiales bacterium]
MQKFFTSLVLITFLLFVGVVPSFAASIPSGDTVKLEEVMTGLYNYHLDKPSLDKLVNGAIEGMLEELNDPYTEYYSSEEFRDFSMSLDNVLQGIGVEMKPGKSYPRIIKVLKSSPAEKSGIQAGDIIESVNGQDIEGMSLSKVVKRIRGPEGTTVKVTVRRGKDKRINFTVARGEVNIPTVEHHMMEDGVGYILVSTFSLNTASEFSDALDNLLDKGIEALIIDLRNNGGGYLSSSIDIASDFLLPGKTVVSAVDGEGKREEFCSSGKAVVSDLPIALLVNDLTASASEVLTGALRDYELAFLVGKQTYGKNVVQSVIPLETGGALKITTHKYYTPSGKTMANGFKPDRIIDMPELQVAAAYQELRDLEKMEIEYNTEKDTIHVNGREINYPVMPEVKTGCTLLPLKCTLEALGYRVECLKKSVKIYGYDNCLKVFPGSTKLYLNNKEKHANNSVKKQQGTTFISLEVLKMLGLNVHSNAGKLSVSKVNP